MEKQADLIYGFIEKRIKFIFVRRQLWDLFGTIAMKEIAVATAIDRAGWYASSFYVDCLAFALMEIYPSSPALTLIKNEARFQSSQAT